MTEAIPRNYWIVSHFLQHRYGMSENKGHKDHSLLCLRITIIIYEVNYYIFPL